MLDIRKLKELVRLMVANDLSELDLRFARCAVRPAVGGGCADRCEDRGVGVPMQEWTP